MRCYVVYAKTVKCFMYPWCIILRFNWYTFVMAEENILSRMIDSFQDLNILTIRASVILGLALPLNIPTTIRKNRVTLYIYCFSTILCDFKEWKFTSGEKRRNYFCGENKFHNLTSHTLFVIKQLIILYASRTKIFVGLFQALHSMHHYTV